MFNQKEISIVIAATIIFSIALAFLKGLEVLLYAFIAIFIVILVNVIAKKITSYYLDSEIEIGHWTFQRYGFKPESKMKNSFPIGFVLPLITSFVTLGYFVWMGTLTFDTKPKTYRAAKRHGLYNFSEITEDHIGLIAGIGVVANLIAAAIGYLLGFQEFANYNIYFAFFNVLPIANLDGNKIFFGNFVLWAFLASLVFLGLGFVFLVV